jgi:hypothetical protein
LEPVTWRPVGQVARPGGSADISQRQVNAYIRDMRIWHVCFPPRGRPPHRLCVCGPMTKRRDPRNKDDHRAIDHQPEGKITPSRLDYARTLDQMICSRFDAVAREKIPDQLFNLVARLKAAPSRAQVRRAWIYPACSETNRPLSFATAVSSLKPASVRSRGAAARPYRAY